MSKVNRRKTGLAVKIMAIAALTVIIACGNVFADYYFEKSARGAALGYGFTALANEPAGVFYNPAGIGFLRGYQINTMFNRITKYGLPSTDENPYSGNLGGYAYFQNFGTVALHLYQMGSFTSNTLLNTTNDMTLSYARMFNPQWSAGLNLKYVFESNYGKRKGADFDLGAIYKPNNMISVAFAVENLFHTKLTPDYLGGTRYMDRVVRSALAYSTDNPGEPTTFAFALGMKQQNVLGEDKTYGLTSLGVEQWFRNDLPFSWALRGSYTISKDNEENFRQFGFGISCKLNNAPNFWRLDYGFQEYPFDAEGLATGNHILSLVYGFGGTSNSASLASKQPVRKAEQVSEEYASLKPAQSPPYTQAPVKQTVQEQNQYITPPAQEERWEKMKLNGRVENLSSLNSPKYMFMLNPEGVSEPLRWKLFIQDSRPAPSNSVTIEARSVRVLEGKGYIPSVISWDGKDKLDAVCRGGKYFYSLSIWDVDGRQWRSAWSEFKVK